MDGDDETTSRRRRRDVRRIVAPLLAVVLAVTLSGGLFALWADHAVFDGHNFADRATKLLDAPAVRAEVADRFTDALIENGPSQLAGFRALIRPAVDDLIGTPAFEELFRTAVREAHRSLFTKGGNDVAVNLSQSLGVLATSMQISNPDVAASIPTGLDQFLVDLGEDIRGMQLWQAGEDLDQLAATLVLASVVLGIAVIALDRDRRRGVLEVGVAVTAAGLLLVGVAVLAPRVAAASVSDPALADALRAGVEVFVGDLQVLGVWVIGYGVVGAALATASAPRRTPLDAGALWGGLKERFRSWQPSTPAGRVGRAAAFITAGVVLVVERDAVVPLAVAVVGAYVTYLGVVQLLAVVGRTPAERMAARAASGVERDRERRVVRVLAAGAALVLVVSLVGVVATTAARSGVAEAAERRCNGSAELCDRTIDRVAFPGSHNSMSSSTEAGWLFAEQSTAIPAQLEYGIRALLVKTHYGIPSGVTLTGTDLVVTDRQAELAVNPRAVEAALPPGTAERAARMATGATVDPAKRDVYLCHVYCEYGATRFLTALQDVERFLDRHPNEVVILFVGNYVSTEDTRRVLEQAGLADRLYEYDPAAPPPTLGQIIDAGKNVVMLSEFSGPPPGWNNDGYGLFQDTPYTFTDAEQLLVPGAAGYRPTGTTYDLGAVDDTVVEPDTARPSATTLAWGPEWTGVPSCRPNRGTPASPLFQVNHWVTPAGAAPTVAQARVVNAYDVLMPRVRACMAERDRFPTIVGVNFATTGDLLRVVDELNEVG